MHTVSSRAPLAHRDLTVLLLAFALALTPVLQSMPQLPASGWTGPASPPATAPAEPQEAPPAGLDAGEWQSVQSPMREAEYQKMI